MIWKLLLYLRLFLYSAWNFRYRESTLFVRLNWLRLILIDQETFNTILIFQTPCESLAFFSSSDKYFYIFIRSLRIRISDSDLLQQVLCIGKVNVWNHLCENTLQWQSKFIVVFSFLFLIFASSSLLSRLATLLLISSSFLAAFFLRLRVSWCAFDLRFLLTFPSSWLLYSTFCRWVLGNISACNELLDHLRIHSDWVNRHACRSSEWVLLLNLYLSSLIKLVRTK